MSNTIHALNRRRSDETFSESTLGEFKYPTQSRAARRVVVRSPMLADVRLCLSLSML
jgi:hypothetical protein